MEDPEAALTAQLTRRRETPLGRAECNAAKNGLFDDALAGRETARGRAYDLGGGAALTGDPTLADTRLDAIRRMTPADVQRIAKRWLDDGKRLTLRYRDESQRPAGYTGDRIADVSTMGPAVPPATLAPVLLADDAAREARPASGSAVLRTLPEVAETRLANGLRVVVAKDRKSTRLNSSH